MKIEIPDNLVARLRSVAKNRALKQYLALLHDQITRVGAIDPNDIERSYKANNLASELIKEHLVDFFDRLGNNEYPEGEYEDME